MSPKPRLCYIFPSALDHAGLKQKVEGQVDTLKLWYRVSLIYPTFKQSSFPFYKGVQLINFSVKAWVISLVSPVIYVRYNPKLPFLFLYLSFLSFFKKIYVEHNSIYDYELGYLNRNIERKVNSILLHCLSFSKLIHITVTDEIRLYFIQHYNFKSNYAVYCQNGISVRDVDLKESSLIDRILKFKKKESRIAVFVGNGYAWHGLDSIIDLLKKYDNIQLLVVGPYDVQCSDDVLYLGKVANRELDVVFNYCDFAFSTFHLNLVQLTQACPLKSRHYLSCGLPIICGYDDCASDISEFKPYVYNIKKDPQAIDKLLKLEYDKSEIKRLSRTHLTWEANWQRAGVLVPIEVRLKIR